MKPITDLKQLALYALLASLTVAGALWAVYGAGHRAGVLEERHTWQGLEQARAESDQALLRQHAADIATLNEQHIITNLKVSSDHEKELAQLRREHDADRLRIDRAGGLRIPAPACPAAGQAEAASPGNRDEAGAGTIRLPLEIENDLWALVDDADQVSAQLRSCQTWIRQNGFYGPEPADSMPLLDRMIAAPNQPAEEPTP